MSVTIWEATTCAPSLFRIDPPGCALLLKNKRATIKCMESDRLTSVTRDQMRDGNDLGSTPNNFSLSIVVPVYKEEGNIPEFLNRITGILGMIASQYEIIFCLDPSPDRTEELILQARQKDRRIKLLKFSRRFGQPMATLAGLQYSSGDAAIVMDVDLQDPPELIHEMVQKWQGGFDVVYAQRRTRDGETWIKKVVSVAGYKLINQIGEVEIPPNTGDF